MIKKIITLFKLARKVAKSDILDIVSKFQTPPVAIRVLFKILSFSFSQNKQININRILLRLYFDQNAHLFLSF